jgi:hypothetical protein
MIDAAHHNIWSTVQQRANAKLHTIGRSSIDRIPKHFAIAMKGCCTKGAGNRQSVSDGTLLPVWRYHHNISKSTHRRDESVNAG